MNGYSIFGVTRDEKGNLSDQIPIQALSPGKDPKEWLTDRTDIGWDTVFAKGGQLFRDMKDAGNTMSLRFNGAFAPYKQADAWHAYTIRIINTETKSVFKVITFPKPIVQKVATKIDQAHYILVEIKINGEPNSV